MQNSFCRLSILEIIIFELNFGADEKNFTLEAPAGRPPDRRTNCENKINYEMIFVSSAKIGIKFFNFPSCMCIWAHISRRQDVKLNADMLCGEGLAALMAQ